MDDVTRRLLTDAMEEIRHLRRVNEVLGAKVEMIDLFKTVLHTRPDYDRRGYGEDVAWKIDLALNQDAQLSATAAAQNRNLGQTAEAPLGERSDPSGHLWPEDQAQAEQPAPLVGPGRDPLRVS